MLVQSESQVTFYSETPVPSLRKQKRKDRTITPSGQKFGSCMESMYLKSVPILKDLFFPFCREDFTLNVVCLLQSLVLFHCAVVLHRSRLSLWLPVIGSQGSGRNQSLHFRLYVGGFSLCSSPLAGNPLSTIAWVFSSSSVCSSVWTLFVLGVGEGLVFLSVSFALDFSFRESAGSYCGVVLVTGP
jgi:hypothetical protein